MKTTLKIFCLVLLLSNYSFASPTVYNIEQSKSSPNILLVSVNRHATNTSTKLILGGVVTAQVQNAKCDGQVVKRIRQGVWLIPAACRKLHWQVPLLKSGMVAAAEQQSIKAGDFILFSTASSLPRLNDAEAPEVLKVNIRSTKTIMPKPNSAGIMPLPTRGQAPLFVLLNTTIVGKKTVSPIKLNYYLDNSKAAYALPSINIHMKGLQWLAAIMRSKKKITFNIGWLGLSVKKMRLAGATGENILLVNYPNDGKLRFGKAMLLYIALHEACHQLMDYPEQPAWVGESLASYYGARAVEMAMPDNANSYAIMLRFQKDGKNFSDGLLAINRKVKAGDRSEYGAFYTKGLAFWLAVDKNLQQINGESLNQKLPAILHAKYNANGEPQNLQKILGLPEKIWLGLSKQFLE